MMDSEQEELPVRRFISYLEYRDCEKGTVFPADIAEMQNSRNGVKVQVPIAHAMIQREMMYWLCLELGINMPNEFAEYQRMMDWAGANPTSALPEEDEQSQ